MGKTKIPILSTEYRNWLIELKHRYRSTQIKMSISINSLLIEFYLNLSKNINEKYSKSDFYGTSFFRVNGRLIWPEIGHFTRLTTFRKLSADLQMEMPGEAGFSQRNIMFACCFCKTDRSAYLCRMRRPSFLCKRLVRSSHKIQCSAGDAV